MTKTRTAELLDELTPPYDDRHGDWERVAAAAREKVPRRLTSSWGARVAVLAAAVAAAAALTLAWPFNSQHGGVLDRALAAIGNGPVLHVVLRGEWGGTLVDANGGDRRPVYGENEIWYDSEDGQTHSIERLGGVVQDEEVSKPKKPEAEYVALGREYRQALEAGTARIIAEDTIDGVPVVWVTIHSELLPDVDDGKDHEWAQQVAVSKRTFKPVALRESRDGRPIPGTLQRVVELELLPRGAGDFTTSRPSREGTSFKQGREAISLAQAAGVLTRRPLWLGRDYDRLPLARVYRETTSIGHQHRVRLTGAKAAAATKCSEQRGSAGGECFRSLGLTSVEVRPDGVFTSGGPITWSDEESSLVLFYGTVGDDPSTYLEDAIPLFHKSYVTVTEAIQVSPLRRGAGSYVPPEGSVFLAAGGGNGFLQWDGIQISIDAGSERAILAAARALTAMPGFG
jgi:hypothetical protein